MRRLSKRQKRVIVFLLGLLLILSTWFSWRLLRVPEVSIVQVMPEHPILSIRVGGLSRLIDRAKENTFIVQAAQTPLAERFTASPTWRYWAYQKSVLEYQLQTRINEQYIREVFGQRAAIGVYPREALFATSIVSVGARLQILWSEWTDLFRGHYDIQKGEYRGISLATLTSSGGVSYYALDGRFGILSTDRTLVETAIDRFRDRPHGPEVDEIVIDIDFTRYPAYFPYGERIRGYPLREWHSRTYTERGRLTSRNRLILSEPFPSVPHRERLPAYLPMDTAIAGFLRVSPEVLWEFVNPYVEIQGNRPPIGRHLLPLSTFALRGSQHLLPSLAAIWSASDHRALADSLSQLHGRVFLNGKRIKVGNASGGESPFYPLSWSPALLVRFQGGYAVTDESVLLSNDTDLLQQILRVRRGQQPALDRLRDFSEHDGAVWVQPERLIPILEQAARLGTLGRLFGGSGLPNLTPVLGSTDPLKLLEEIRTAVRMDGNTIEWRFEVASR